MSFPRPTLTALRQQARAYVAGRMGGTDPALRRSGIMIQAESMAGLVHLLFGYLDFIARMTIPVTAEGEYLDRWAQLVGLPRKAATPAVGQADLTGTGPDGTLVPAGTVLTRGDGVTYVTTADASLAAGAATADVEAEEPGEAGNLEAGASITLQIAIVGINGTALVAEGGITGGGPEESDEALQQRLKARLSDPPAGGAAHDYLQWALEVPGVTRAWVLPLNRGLGTVDVTFVMDDRDDIIPLSGDVAAVQAYIDERRPVTADSVVFAPDPDPLDVTITGLSPDNPEVRAAIRAEFAAFVKRDAAPAGTIFYSRLNEAISRAAGESHHNLTVPSGNTTYPAGHIPVPGTVTFAP